MNGLEDCSVNGERKNRKRKADMSADVVELKRKVKNNYTTLSTASVCVHAGTVGNTISQNHAKIQDVTIANEEEESSNTEQVTNEVNLLTGKSLRRKFASAEGLDVLKKFVTICNENKEMDLVGEYLHAGGSLREVLRLLDTSDKKNINNVTIVFSAMHIIIMKILAQYPQYHSNAKEACQHLINSYLSFVHSMLSIQSNAKQRKVVLRLLAAIVSLEGTLARELLGHLSLHSQILEILVRPSKPTDPQSVRTCFIYFVLAFLVEGNISAIRALLDKQGVLFSIFPDLIYDSHNTVHLVLTTVKTYVLENPGISKTTKLHTFSTPVIRSLIRLYNWKGPRNWPGYKKQNVSSDYSHEAEINSEEKKVVVEAVHEFLLTLLTSKRYGIIFHDRTLGTSGRKHNQLVNTILQSLDHPWEHAKPLDLVLNILVACPDLVKLQLTYIEPFLKPKASKKWITVMKFIRQIIESMDAEICLKPCFSELTVSQLVSAVITLTIPFVVIKNAIVPAFTDTDIILRYEAASLLIVMFNQLKMFIKVITDNCLDILDLMLFKRSITDYILKNFPNLHTILKIWNNTLLAVTKTDSPNQKDQIEINLILTQRKYLEVILNLLLLYQDVCPPLLDTEFMLHSHIQPIILLSELNRLYDTDKEEFNKIKIKALQLLLAINSTSFAPEKELFGETLSFLMMLLDHKSTAIDSRSRTVINTLLNASDLFEGCSNQIEIWLNCIYILDCVDERHEVVIWLVEVIRKVIKNINKYIDLITKAKEIAGEQIFSTGRVEDMLNEFSENCTADRNMKNVKLQSSITIPPLLSGALESVKKNPRNVLLRYLSHVITHTLHCQVAPGTLIKLVQNVEELPVKEYLSNWLQHDSTPTHIKKPFNSKSTIYKLSKALLANKKIQINEIFYGEKKISFISEGYEVTFSHSLSKYEVLSLLAMTLFYLTQLAQRGNLTPEQNYNYKVVIISILHAAKDIEDKEDSNFIEDCLKLIFRHPIILQYYSPLCKKKNTLERNITILFFDICKAVIDLNETHFVSELFLPFKSKLIVQLLTAVKKSQNGDKKQDFSIVIKFIEILRLNMKEIVELLTAIVKLSKETLISKDKSCLSIWGIIIPKLLEISSKQRGDYDGDNFFTLDKYFIEKISSYLIELNKIDTLNLDIWETNLYEYLHNFPHNIIGIDINLFKSLMKKKATQSTNKLLLLLVSRNPKFISLYIKFVTNNEGALKQSNTIFSILSSSMNYKWGREEQTFLKKLYDFYKDDIVSYFCNPASAKPWIEENVKAVICLIETNFDSEICNKTCEIVLSNGEKLDLVNVCYVELLKSLFNKASSLQADKMNSLKDLIQILVRIAASTLKKDSTKNMEKLNILCKGLCSTVDSLTEKNSDFVFEELNKNYSWPQFTRFSLKSGLNIFKENQVHVPLLNTLSKLCDVVYKNDDNNEYVKKLFEMTTSHSEFINVILSTSTVKRDLVRLLWVLVRKNNSTMMLTHVPLYLAAYNATLSESDQYILLLLQHYENHNIKLNQYRPYLWGNAAATHYSIIGETDTALWRQPSTSQVLNLLTPEIVNTTIKNYPVHRKIKCDDLYAADTIYDPAFYLPLLCHLLSENNIVACHKVTQSGALALALAACGSSCNQTRLAAYTVVSRFYFHLEATSSKEKLLWMHFVDALRNGIASLEPTLSDIRLNCLVSTFLAKASLVATQPLNPLYSPLLTFLMAKSALDLNAIPELLQLFHSSEIEHRAHRHWILEVIRDGIKTEKDMEIALKCFLFRMLFDFYTSVLSDQRTKCLILEIIESAVKVPKAGLLLMTGYSLLPWLNEIVISLDLHNMNSVIVIMSIVRSLLNAFSRTGIKAMQTRFMLLNILINLKSHLSKNISITCYIDYINTLESILSTKVLRNTLTTKNMMDLVKFSKKLLGRVDDCEDMLYYGCRFVIQTENLRLEDNMAIARESLRRLILTWCPGDDE